jgi:hypothetical protein
MNVNIFSVYGVEIKEICNNVASCLRGSRRPQVKMNHFTHGSCSTLRVQEIVNSYRDPWLYHLLSPA